MKHLLNTKFLTFLCLLTLLTQSLLAKKVVIPSESGRILYQVSTVSALAKGVYDGKYTYGELKKHGDFGLGTFLNLDGEMIALDGSFYQIKSDGDTKLVDNKQVAPFAEVSYFKPTIKVKLKPAKSFNDLTSNLLTIFKNKNVPYSIRIDGTFRSIKVRSVAKQKVPFKTLLEASKVQTVFNLDNIKGTIVGY